MPSFPFKYSKMLTVIATMLTEDQSGQNYEASELTLKTFTWFSFGKTPPKSKMRTMVSMVSLNPLMV